MVIHPHPVPPSSLVIYPSPLTPCASGEGKATPAPGVVLVMIASGMDMRLVDMRPKLRRQAKNTSHPKRKQSQERKNEAGISGGMNSEAYLSSGFPDM